MRSFSRIAFAIFAGLAALWLVAGDLIALVVPLPHNELKIELTRHVQGVHFHHYATGPMWLTWILVLVIGGKMKRWGKEQLGLGAVAGLIGTLPLLATVRLGWKLLFGADKPGICTIIVGLLAVMLVLAAKGIVLRMWWQVVRTRSGGPCLMTEN